MENTSNNINSNNLTPIYEDDFIVAFNKFSGVIIHHSNYSRNVISPSLTELVNEFSSSKLIPIHRLDGKTTGVILFAKAPGYLNAFQLLFQKNKIKKKYWALVRGYTPDEIIIDKKIGPPKSEKQRMNKSDVVYKEARTVLKTIAQNEFPYAIPPYSTSRYSWVEFSPETGRTHQLRIHANHISHPIIGDHKYGDRNHNKFFANELKTDQMFLHAKTVEFLHPYTNTEITISAELPSYWEKLSTFQVLMSQAQNNVVKT